MTSARLLAAVAVITVYVLFCLAVLRRERRRRWLARRETERFRGNADGMPPVLVLHASQTGQAQAIARDSASALSGAGVPVELAPLGDVDRARLHGPRRILIVASTYGEGDPPDSVAPFVATLAGSPPDLRGVQFGMLALGDRRYRQFCGFGKVLDEWLQRCQARPIFPRIDVDDGDVQALRAWQGRLADIAGSRLKEEWRTERPFTAWRLVARTLLNEGSLGEPLYRLAFEAVLPAGSPAPAPGWHAGDIAEVQVPADPARARDYSIASLAASGRLELLIRRARRADGRPGVASGWLTGDMSPGDQVLIRVRDNPGFRQQGNTDRPLLLIGNGSGFAGLRAHMLARVAGGRPGPGCWLLFGERQTQSDGWFLSELDAWREAGVLSRVDLAFSRDDPVRRLYVQDRLAERADLLREWVRDGAAIYVCGSVQGMAPAVDRRLREVLGDDEVAALTTQGRYRRDVY